MTEHEQLLNSDPVYRAAYERIKQGDLLCKVEQYNDIKEFVLVAVTSNGLNLQFASPRLKNDPDVVIAAINKKPKSFCWASNRLKNDYTVALHAAEKGKSEVSNEISRRLRVNYDIFPYIIGGSPPKFTFLYLKENKIHDTCPKQMWDYIVRSLTVSYNEEIPEFKYDEYGEIIR